MFTREFTTEYGESFKITFLDDRKYRINNAKREYKGGETYVIRLFGERHFLSVKGIRPEDVKLSLGIGHSYLLTSL